MSTSTGNGRTEFAKEQHSKLALHDAVEKQTELRGNHYPLWSPRFWNGMTLGDYMNLLWQGRFRVSPGRWHLALITLVTSVFNSMLALVQWVFYARKIRRARVESPVFVIGHFRTGTTMMLEHLACDPRFSYPTTYACFSPRHFLISERLLSRLVSWLLPGKRPMDNMSAGFSHPQEDEFALLSLAAPTIYQRLAFPNQPVKHFETLRFENQNSNAFVQWKRKLLWFYRALTVRSPNKRLLVKSPCHTGRIKLLLQLFPDAKFVHMVRDPRAILPSIRNAWRVLELTQGLQTPDNLARIDAFIFETLEEMYRGYWSALEEVPPSQICQVKYEKLIENPLEEMNRVYRELSLGGSDDAREALEKRLEKLADYAPNSFEIDNEVDSQSIKKHWQKYAKNFEYELS